jgi:aconitate hydratase
LTVLGVDGVIAESFARIHFANLVNFGIVPLTFAGDGVYDRLGEGDEIEIADDVAARIREGAERVTAEVNGEWTFEARVDLTAEEREMLIAGGKLPRLKRSADR